ncbi:hypothetical protein D2962_01645 [Biomaibacter acetigenes]|uniref:Uncharacterized protein n=1 Tax=Biomaibacter acetigenes TaxID=2316383 RepID=A0A3G2R1Z4_9FIRM|nr:hypothetical protein D2962_01645 [Biomaibacter acetigenes]RKL61529.1 hypothetical protein DXT63_16260 [Thermoanaerobacteraceae bacterium SP2]
MLMEVNNILSLFKFHYCLFQSADPFQKNFFIWLILLLCSSTYCIIKKMKGAEIISVEKSVSYIAKL